MVGRGFSPMHGIDYNKTFSPVVKYDSIRVLFAYAVNQGLNTCQLEKQPMGYKVLEDFEVLQSN